MPASGAGGVASGRQVQDVARKHVAQDLRRAPEDGCGACLQELSGGVKVVGHGVEQAGVLAGELQHGLRDALEQLGLHDLEDRHVLSERLAALERFHEGLVEGLEVVELHAEARIGIEEHRVVGLAERDRQAAQAGKAVGGELGRSDGDALEAEQRLGVGPALVDRAHQVFFRHADIVEKDLAELVMQIEVDDRPYGDAGAVHGQQDEGDALLLLG